MAVVEIHDSPSGRAIEVNEADTPSGSLVAFFQASIGEVVGDFAGPFTNQAAHALEARSQWLVTEPTTLKRFALISDENGGVAAAQGGQLRLNGADVAGALVTIGIGAQRAVVAIDVDVVAGDLLSVALTSNNAAAFLSWYLTN